MRIFFGRNGCRLPHAVSNYIELARLNNLKADFFCTFPCECINHGCQLAKFESLKPVTIVHPPPILDQIISYVILLLCFHSRMQSSSTSTQIPLCNEYCDGNTAEFYCPECSAMFCGSCYDREHCGNERKSQHGKLTELRAICCAHKHTLDYFNLTTLQPMCVICRKETLQSPEFAHHVIDNIEVTVPKLRSLMEKKLNTASELIDRLSSEIAKVENAAKNTTIAAVNYIKCAFLKLRKYLDESEAELVQSARRYFDEFLEVNDERVEVKNAIRNLRALAEEGKVYKYCVFVKFNT